MPGVAACVAAGRLPEAYLELHVEQGPVLARAGAALGIVTAIFGQAQGEVVFEGRADHAGTTPMDAREDALAAAAEFVLRVRSAARPRHGRDGRPARGRARDPERRSGPRAVASVDVRAARARPSSTRSSPPSASSRLAESSRSQMSGAPLEALRAAAPGAPELPSRAPGTTPESSRRPACRRDALRPQPERRGRPLARRALDARRTSQLGIDALAAGASLGSPDDRPSAR